MFSYYLFEKISILLFKNYGDCREDNFFCTDDTGDNIVLKTFILTGVLVSEDVPSSNHIYLHLDVIGKTKIYYDGTTM